MPDARLFMPVGVYHGPNGWRVVTDFGDLFSGPPALRRYWPSFRYEVIDLSRYSDEEIRGTALAQATLQLMKHIFSGDLGQRLPHIIRLLKDLVDARTVHEMLTAIGSYVAARGEGITRAIHRGN